MLPVGRFFSSSTRWPCVAWLFICEAALTRCGMIYFTSVPARFSAACRKLESPMGSDAMEWDDMALPHCVWTEMRTYLSKVYSKKSTLHSTDRAHDTIDQPMSEMGGRSKADSLPSKTPTPDLAVPISNPISIPMPLHLADLAGWGPTKKKPSNLDARCALSTTATAQHSALTDVPRALSHPGSDAGYMDMTWPSVRCGMAWHGMVGGHGAMQCAVLPDRRRRCCWSWFPVVVMWLVGEDGVSWEGRVETFLFSLCRCV